MLDAPLFQPFGIVPSAAPITPHNIKAGGKKRKTSVGLKLFIFPKGTDLQRKGGQYSIDTVSMSIATVVVSSRPVTIIALTLDSAKRNEIQCDRKMFFQ